MLNESKRVTDINGWFTVNDNPIAKIGVFPYSGRTIGAENPNEVYQVYRPEEELSNPDTINSFKLLPFTNDHPTDMLGVSDDLPTVDGKPAEGVIGEQVYYKDGYLLGNLKVFTNRIVGAINAGKREVSAGYRCIYEKASGVFNGQPYDYIQRNIRGNHLALVKQGRMGADVAVLDHLTLTFDSMELIQMPDQIETKDAEKETAQPEMSLSEVIAMVKAIAPQVKALTDAMASMTTGAAAHAEPDGDEVVTTDAVKPAESQAMDALEKRLKALESASKPIVAKGLDAKDVFAAAANRDTLYRGVSAVVGAFEHSAMDSLDVAKYAVDKLGLNAPAGTEIVAVQAYLAAKPAKSSYGFDSKNNAAETSAIRKHLNQE